MTIYCVICGGAFSPEATCEIELAMTDDPELQPVCDVCLDTELAKAAGAGTGLYEINLLPPKTTNGK